MRVEYLSIIIVVCLSLCCKSNYVPSSPQQQIPDSKISLANTIFSDGSIFLGGGTIGHAYHYKFGDTSYQKYVYVHYSEPYKTILMESGNYKVTEQSLSFHPKIKMLCSIENFIPYIDCADIGEFTNYFYVQSDTLNDQIIKDLGFLPRKTEISFEENKMIFTDPALNIVRFKQILR